MKGLSIRDYARHEAEALARLVHAAVQRGAAGHYDQAQRDAWCAAPPEGTAWSDRLENGQTVVVVLAGRIVGFMSLDVERGLIDLAYVDPDFQGRGVAGALYAVIEGRARAAGLALLEVEASLVAEPFFRRRGWTCTARQTVERVGVSIPNARMEKHLSSAVDRVRCAAS